MFKTTVAPAGIPGLGTGYSGNALGSSVGNFQASVDSIADSIKLSPPVVATADAGDEITSAPIWLNPATNQYYVPNFGAFEVDNDTALVQSLGVISSGAAVRGANPDLAAGWVPVSPTTFAQRAEEIQNPGLLTLMSKNFGIGVDNMQMLAGYGLQVAGLEGIGQGIVAQQEQDLQKTAIYNRQLEDINSVGTGLEWLAATIGQLGPSIVESMAAAAVGAVVGGGTAGAATGGVGAAPGAALGAITGFFGKQTVKQILKTAAEKIAKKEALSEVETRVMKKALGTTLAAKMTTDAQLVAATQAVRAGVKRGAQVGAIGSNYLLGVGDVYANTLEGGGEGSRLIALIGGVPYAAAESLGEFHLAGRIFGDTVKTTKPLNALNWAGKAGEVAKRFGSGALVSGGIEGGTEGFQEFIGILADPTTDLNSGAGFSRVANAFAAGAAGGVLLGGLGNLGGKQPVNALQPTVDPVTGKPVNPNAPAPTEQQLELPLQFTDEAFAARQPQGQQVPLQFPTTYVSEPAPSAVPDTATIAERQVAPVAFSNQPYVAPQPPVPASQGERVAPVQPVLSQEEQARAELGRLTRAANDLRALAKTDAVAAQRVAPQLAQIDAAIKKLSPQVQPVTPTVQQAPSAADVATMQAQPELPLTPPPPPVAAPKAKKLTKAQRRAAEVAAQPPLPTPTVVPPSEMALPPAPATKLKRGKKTAAPTPVAPPLVVPPAPAAPVAPATKLKRGKPRAAPTPVTAPVTPAPAAPKVATKQDYDEYITKYTKPRYEQNEQVVGASNAIAAMLDLIQALKDGVITQEQYNALDNTLNVGGDSQPPRTRRFNNNFVTMLMANRDGIEIQTARPASAAAPAAPAMSGVEAARAAGVAIEDIPYTTNKGVEGVSPIINLIAGDMTGRKIVVVNINGVRVPFYISTGKGGKKGVTVGKWYPFFGISKEGSWFNKGSEAEISNYYGSAELKAVAEQLDATIGDIRSDMSFPLVVDEGRHMDVINQDMSPTENKLKETRANLDANIANVLSRIRGKQTTPDTGTTASVAFMMTNKARAELAALGYSADEIKNMKPADAQVILQEGRRPTTQPKTKTDELKKGNKTNASKDRKDQQGNQQQRTDAGERLQEDGQDRNVAPQEQAGSDQTGRGNQPAEGGPQPKVVTGADRLRARRNAAVAANEASARKINPIQAKNLETLGYSKSAVDIMPMADIERILRQKIKAPTSTVTLARTPTAANEGEAALASPLYKKYYASGKMTTESFKAAVAALADLGATAKQKAGEVRWLIVQASNTKSQDSTPSVKLLNDMVDDAIKNKRDEVVAIVNDVLTKFPDATAEELTVIKPLMAKTGIGGTLTKQTATPKALAKTKKSEAAIAEDMAPIAEMDKPGRHLRSDGSLITQPLSIGRVKLLVSNFASKLTMKPKIHTYRNVADLRAKNPELFRRADAARAEGDFTTTDALGYSFGDEVIIFSDHIQTEQSLAFTLAHEVVGHYGIRALMPRAEFVRLVDKLNADSRIRVSVDKMMELYGTDRLEATEEFLANAAAVLDVSIWRQLSYALKNILNRLGIQFHDDALRPLISQSRKYIRNGKQGSFVSHASIAQNLKDMQDWAAHGVFRTDPMDQTELGNRMAVHSGISQIGSGLQELAEAVRSGEYAEAAKIGSSGIKSAVDDVLRQVQTMNNKANKNVGLSTFFRLINMQTDAIKTMRTNYAKAIKFTTQVNWLRSSKAATQEDRDLANKLLAYTTLRGLRSVTDKTINSYGDIATLNPDGTITQNDAVIEQLFQAGLVTPEQFTAGITYKDSLGNEQKFQADVTADSKAYRIYLEMRNAMKLSFVDMLMSKYHSLSQQKNSFGRRMKDQGFSDADVATLQKISDQYRKLYFSGVTYDRGHAIYDKKATDLADEFVRQAARVFYADEKLNDWLTKGGETEAFQGAEYADIISGMPSLAQNKVRNLDKFNAIQAAIKNVALVAGDIKSAEYDAKRNLLEGYAPLDREGKFQMRMEAYDVQTGKQVKLSAEFQGVMPYMRHDNKAVLQKIGSKLDEDFAGQWTVKDINNKEVVVELRTKTSVGQIAAETGDAGNYRDFAMLINRFNLQLNPQKQREIITALSDASDSIRDNLMRQGNIGWNPNMIQTSSQFLNMAAARAAKDRFRFALEDVISDDDLWEGSYDELIRLRTEYEQATGETRKYKQRVYEDYAFKYIESHKVGNDLESEVVINGKKHKTKGGADLYRAEGRALMQYMAENRDLIDGTGAFFGTEVGSSLKTTAVVLQLGMSIATSVANLTSLPTHSYSYLAFRNAQRNYGLGHGESAAAAALAKASWQMKNFVYADIDALEQMLADGSYVQKDITKDELEFMIEQTANGVLAISMSDALRGAARGKEAGSKTQDAIDKWMSTFAYTERFTRRATALAAYRLELARNMAVVAEGGMTADEARQAAAFAAEQAVNISQGNYDATNRPSASRGNFTSLLFMYKMYGIITVEMMRNLPLKGKLQFLAMMILLSGVKGIPGEEDLTDLITFLAQTFGLKMADADAEMAELFDAILPGSAPWLMRGALDGLTGLTFSSRVGQGDLIPLTGAMNYGADPWREAKDFGGPVLGALLGLVNWGRLGVRYTTEVLGLNPDTTSFTQVLRESPAAFLRSIGDTVAYMDNNAIVNTRGQIISRDVGALTLLGRLAGFQPASTTFQNDIVRISRATDAYAKDMSVKFTNAYLRAKLSGDIAGANAVMRDIRAWNVSAQGTGLEFKDPEKKLARSLKEASRPTVARYRRTTSENVRSQVDELTRIFGVSPDTGLQQ